MENILKVADYEKLLNTISVLVKEAIKKEFHLEDPYGEEQVFKIDNMSIAILSNFTKMYKINNQAIDQKETITSKSILVRLSIKNKKKSTMYILGYNDVTLDAKNFKIFFYQNLNFWVNNAVRQFFGTPKTLNKYSWQTKDPVEEHIEKINLKQGISQETVNAALQMTHNLHKNIEEVRNAETVISREFTVLLFADAEGRKILSKSNEFFGIGTSVSFINKQSFAIEKTSVIYAITETELQKGIEKNYDTLEKSVRENEKIHFLETGWYPIFMNTDATHTLFHEGIAGHLLSGKYIVEEDSKIFEVLNKDFSLDPQFAILKQLTIENKPKKPGTIATYAFDHEGIRAKNIVLMDKGKITNYLTDRNSAYRLKHKESNGTSLASVFVADTENGPMIIKPEPRISNLIITSHSNQTKEEIRENLIKQCKKENLDFYLEISSKAGEVFVEDGVFNLFIDECDMVYLNGQRKKVWGGTLSGNLFEFISAIKDISQETENDDGKCGSGSGWIPTHGEAPYMTLGKFQFVATKKPLKMDLNLNQKYVPEEE